MSGASLRSERVWQCFKDRPGATVADVKQMLKGSDVPASSVSAFAAQLVDAGALKMVGTKVVKGRDVKTYEAARDTFRPVADTEGGSANPPPAARSARPTPPPSSPASRPPGASITIPPLPADIKTKTERLWLVVKANPNVTVTEVMAVADKLDIPASSMPAMFTTLKTRGRFIANQDVKPWRFAAVGDTYDALNSVPDAPPQPAAVGHHKASGTKLTRWSQEEIEALCRKWAHEHVEHALSLSDKGLARVAAMEGHGYRPRPHMGAALRRLFIERNEPLVKSEVAALREAKANPPAPAAAPAPAPEAVSLGSLIDRAIREAVAAETQKWAGLVMQAVRDALTSLPGYHADSMPQTDPAPLPAPPAKKTAPKVIVVNALPEQFNSVKRAFPDLDLRHVEGRMPGEDTADLVISLTKFMTHPLDRALRKKFGPAYCPVNGAADSVKQAITARLSIPRVQ